MRDILDSLMVLSFNFLEHIKEKNDDDDIAIVFEMMWCVRCASFK